MELRESINTRKLITFSLHVLRPALERVLTLSRSFQRAKNLLFMFASLSRKNVTDGG